MSAMVLHEAGLEFRSEDGEPHIRDLDLAERLGYEHPFRIRELIEKNSNRLGVLTSAVRTHGKAGGRTVESGDKADFWRRMEREYAGGMLQLSLARGA